MEFQKEDYIKYRAAKSKSTLLEVKVLLENQFWNTAIIPAFIWLVHYW